MKHLLQILAVTICLAVPVTPPWAQPPHQHLIAVTSTADTGSGSLRDAVATARSGDTIVFNVTVPIALDSPVTIARNLTIDGPATVNAGLATELFIVNSGLSVTIRALSMGGGFGPGVGCIQNDGALSLVNSNIQGTEAIGGDGAISNSGTMTITNSTISGNSSLLGTGGINNFGTMTITKSTISANQVSESSGGGIYNSGTLSITDSTLSSNSAGGFAGGLGGAIANGGTLNVTNCAFKGNQAENGGGAIVSGGTLNVINSTFIDSGESLRRDAIVLTFGTATLTNSTLENVGDLFVAGGSVSLKGVILVGGEGVPAGEFPNCLGAVSDNGYNISDDNSCAFSAVGSQNGTDPKLDPNGLQNNGGPTQTIALLSGSPAIDAIPIADCTDQASPSNRITTDQRGDLRPDPGEFACDIGADEFQDLAGQANCYIKSVAALAQQYGGLKAAASACGFSIGALKTAITTSCGG